VQTRQTVGWQVSVRPVPTCTLYRDPLLTSWRKRPALTAMSSLTHATPLMDTSLTLISGALKIFSEEVLSFLCYALSVQSTSSSRKSSSPLAPPHHPARHGALKIWSLSTCSTSPHSPFPPARPSVIAVVREEGARRHHPWSGRRPHLCSTPSLQSSGSCSVHRRQWSRSESGCSDQASRSCYVHVKHPPFRSAASYVRVILTKADDYSITEEER
jgi:hypothetical protein